MDVPRRTAVLQYVHSSQFHQEKKKAPEGALEFLQSLCRQLCRSEGSLRLLCPVTPPIVDWRRLKSTNRTRLVLHRPRTLAGAVRGRCASSSFHQTVLKTERVEVVDCGGRGGERNILRFRQELAPLLVQLLDFR